MSGKNILIIVALTLLLVKVPLQIRLAPPGPVVRCSEPPPNKSLDASGGSVFRNLIGPASGA